MRNLLSKIGLAKSDEAIIAEIHNEFDTTQDRLLLEAKEILDTVKVEGISNIEHKAKRLKQIGFTNTPLVKKSDWLRKQRTETEEKLISTESEAKLIESYKFHYPFLKFLTENELDKICKKYNLIYAPVENFIADVPDKNLREIENAKALESCHKPDKYYTVTISKFMGGVPKQIKTLLSGKVRYTGTFCGDEPTESGLQEVLKKKGYTGDYKGYIMYKGRVHEEDRSGLFICAPSSNFDLQGLNKGKGLGFFKVRSWEIKDPIVFRYCKGGIQVLSKWGLEASDPALLNEINN